eukprot:1002791-Lingulodinium_polyedra.AAC.1
MRGFAAERERVAALFEAFRRSQPAGHGYASGVAGGAAVVTPKGPASREAALVGNWLAPARSAGGAAVP